MSENNKSIVEEALLSMKNLEDIISENAKGILASTMKEEIGELVRESLSGSKKRSLREQGEASVEGGDLPVEDQEVEVDAETQMGDETYVDDTEIETESEPTNVDNQELPPLDMTQSPMSDVLKVFKLMGDSDGIIVQKDENGDVHIKDQENEYIITMDNSNNLQNMNESEEGMDLSNLKFDLSSLGTKLNNFEEMSYEEENEDYNFEEMSYGEENEDYNFEEMSYGEENEETVFEIDQEELESVLESFKYSKTPNMEKVSYKKDKAPERHGKGGNAKNAMKYPSKLKHGVTETGDKEEEYEGWEQTESDDLVFGADDYKETETKEAARTLGNGRKWGRKGLPKPRTAPRHIAVESMKEEINLLREKNEEYKKALGFFKNKLNEVAVFNSNLAYSTRLFTEHSTTKQEKINILRRFDNVETIKESKNLYQSIKKELDVKGTSNVVKESITERVVKTPQTGSSSNLIETKTYENPQFMRMKDLMTKIK
jgi:hypothetical protein